MTIGGLLGADLIRAGDTLVATGLFVELDCLGFRPSMPAMLATAVVLELDDLLREIDLGGPSPSSEEFLFAETLRFVFPDLHRLPL